MPLNPTEEEQRALARRAEASFQDRLRAAYWWGFGFGAVPLLVIVAILVVSQ